MKLSMLFGAALVMFSSVAFAYDDTYIGNVSPHGETTVVRKIPKGRHSVEVFTDGTDKVGAHVYSVSGGVDYTCENTSHCTHVLDTNLDLEASFTINSSADKSVGFRVWVH